MSLKHLTVVVGALLLLSGCAEKEPETKLIMQEQVLSKSSQTEEISSSQEETSESSKPAEISSNSYADLTIDEVTPMMYKLIAQQLEDPTAVELSVAALGEETIEGESCYSYQAMDNKPEKAQTLGFYAVNKSVTKLYLLDVATNEYKLVAEFVG